MSKVLSLTGKQVEALMLLLHNTATTETPELVEIFHKLNKPTQAKPSKNFDGQNVMEVDPNWDPA